MHTFGGKADNWQDIILLELSSSPCVLRNEALVPSGYVPAGHRMSPSFHRLFFFLAKHNQAETGFKKNCCLMKGENSITSFCVGLMFKSAKIQWLGTEIVF